MEKSVGVAVWVFVEEGDRVTVAVAVLERRGVSVTVELVGELVEEGVDPDSALQPDKPYVNKIINRVQVEILFDLSRRLLALSSNAIY